MRKDLLLLVVLAVVFVLAVGVLFFLEVFESDVYEGEFGLVDDGDDFEVNPDDGVSVSGGGSGVVGVGEGVVVINGVSVNVSEFECGFYFEGYGVCAGNCPDGVCVSEGRSCYCKS